MFDLRRGVIVCYVLSRVRVSRIEHAALGPEGGRGPRGLPLFSFYTAYCTLLIALIALAVMTDLTVMTVVTVMAIFTAAMVLALAMALTMAPVVALVVALIISLNIAARMAIALRFDGRYGSDGMGWRLLTHFHSFISRFFFDHLLVLDLECSPCLFKGGGGG